MARTVCRGVFVMLAWAAASACALNTSGIASGDAGDAAPDEAGDGEVVPADDGDVPRDDADTVEVSVTCGDGVPDPGEACDEGSGNSDLRPNACRTDCRLPHCGDRVLDAGEACDDGNLDDTDGCRNNCSRPSCGDATVQAGEQCDDGDADDTDACLSTCRDATCGDMVVRAGHEQCDGFARACTTGCASVGVQNCDACVLGPCTPPLERCNGRDDDCDLVADEDFPCIAGATVDCTTACGGAGTGTCSTACELPAGPACTGPPDVCNGLDDDCDLGTDEDFECVSGVVELCTTGGGAAGARSCDLAACTWTLCCATEELCRTTCAVEAFDDDCDGLTDEDCPPCNDTCAGAPVLTGTTSVSGTTVGAGDDFPVSCGGTGVAADVWYTLELSQRSLVWFDTLGSTWDTVVELRAGACPGLSRVCIDDSCTSQQTVWFGALDAGIYQLMVTGFGGLSGAFDLHLQVFPVPGGDPIQITGNGDYNGDTTGAGDDHAGSCGGGGAPDIDYYAALCESRTVNTSTCHRAGETDIDTVIYWLGADGTELACNDDPTSGCGEPGRSVLADTVLPVGLSLLVADGKGTAAGRVRTTISSW